MSDQIKNPKHYQILEGVESIEIIASAMIPEQWHGWKQTFQMHPAIEQMFKTRERNTIESKPQSTVI